MDREAFELRQQWAKANLERCKKEIKEYSEKVRNYKYLLDKAIYDSLEYEDILEEEYKEN